MNVFKRLLCYTLVVFFAAVSVASAAQPRQEAKGEEPVLVGRIAHVEGQLLRYVPEEQDWVATVKDAPFGLDDALYSDENANAEFVMPNKVWARIGGSTQIQLIVLKPDVTEIDVASGIARFYNRSKEGVVKATTPFGYVMAPPGSVFDLYVGDESVEVISLVGDVDFVDENQQSKYEVSAGSSSIVADSRSVASGEGNVDAEWDDWNSERDTLWSKRVEVKGDSTRYLPDELADDAYDLEENGRWETVSYEGRETRLWRPTTVEVGWTPFTVGRWTTYYEDQTWVPAEPFGYVTHHYGNWVFVNGGWYWAPPVARPVAVVGVAPVVGIGFGWYPGRVAWIGTGVNVGWVPLAPTEVYYTHRWWGPRATIVTNVAAVNINIGGLRWADHAVVIGAGSLYSVNNYRTVRVTNINRTTIINNYRGAPVVNRTIVNNIPAGRQRFAFNANANVVRTPHQTVVNRIQRNEQVSQRVARTASARNIEQQVATTRVAKATEVKQARPRVTNKLVDPDAVKKPVDQVKFQQKELKAKPKPAQDSRITKDERLNQKLDVSPQKAKAAREVGQGRATGAEGGGRQVGPAGEAGGRVRPEPPGGRGRKVGPAEEGPGRRVGPDTTGEAMRGGRKVGPAEEGPGRRVGPDEQGVGKRGGASEAVEPGGRRVRPGKPGTEDLQQGQTGEAGRRGRKLDTETPGRGQADTVERGGRRGRAADVEQGGGAQGGAAEKNIRGRRAPAENAQPRTLEEPKGRRGRQIEQAPQGQSDSPRRRGRGQEDLQGPRSMREDISPRGGRGEAAAARMDRARASEDRRQQMMERRQQAQPERMMQRQQAMERRQQLQAPRAQQHPQAQGDERKKNRRELQ